MCKTLLFWDFGGCFFWDKTTFGGTTTQKKRILGGGHRTYFVDEGNTWGEDTAQHNIERWEGGHRTYFVDGRNNWGGDTAQHRKKKLSCGWVGGGPSQEIIPLRGSILHAETCQILNLAENPRWSPSVAIFINKI